MGKNRVLRLMRENGLLAPIRPESTRVGRMAGSRRMCRTSCGHGRDAVLHEGGWGGAGSSWRWITASQTYGLARAKNGDRVGSARADPRVYEPTWTATRPRSLWGGLRHDWGPQYTAHQFQGELAWLDPLDGLVRRRAGVQRLAERFMRSEGRVPVPPDFEISRRPGRRSMRSSNATTAGGSWSGTGIGPRPRSSSGAHPEGGMIRPPNLSRKPEPGTPRWLSTGHRCPLPARVSRNIGSAL